MFLKLVGNGFRCLESSLLPMHPHSFLKKSMLLDQHAGDSGLKTCFLQLSLLSNNKNTWISSMFKCLIIWNMKLIWCPLKTYCNAPDIFTSALIKKWSWSSNPYRYDEACSKKQTKKSCLHYANHYETCTNLQNMHLVMLEVAKAKVLMLCFLFSLLSLLNAGSTIFG